MKKYLAIFGWMVPVLAYAVTVPLPIPKYGEASLQSANTVAFDNTHSVFVNATNVNAFTYCGWFRCEAITNVAMPMAALACGAISVVPARATLEGGSKLENIMPFDMDTDVPLDSIGEWSAVVLPANPDVPASMTYGGAYCINVICDKACVVTVGGVEIDVPISNEVFIRNVWPDSKDNRTVSVSTDAGASVKLGIACNPIVKFYPVQTDSVDANGDFNYGGGVVTNEYRFLVWRAKLDGENLMFEVGGWVRGGKLACWRTNLVECSAKTFAKDARFKLDFGAAAEGSWAKLNVREFGIKAYGEWVDDDLLLLMRDKDWEEMVRRGVTYDSERGEGWRIEADVETIASSKGEIVAKTDAASTVEYTTQSEVRNSSRKMVMHAKSYLLDGFVVSDDDMKWTCETLGASYTQSSNVFEFAAGGKYRIRGYNRMLGEARELDVNLSDGQAYVNYVVGNPTDKTKPYAHALAAVVDAMGAAKIAPRVYYKNGNIQTANCVSVKHIPAVPIYSSAGAQGNRGVAALSKHTWISAAHWGGFVKSDLKFTDGGTITNSVRTDGSWVNLKTWAKANGFSDEACAAVNDIAVGTFAEGAVDDAFVPYLMDGAAMSNAFGNVAVAAFRATQVEQGAALPVVVRGGSDLQYISGQSVDAEEWVNEKGFAASDVESWKTLPAADLVDAVAAMVARKAVDAPLFPACFSGDSGLPTYVEVEDGVYVLITQNWTICGGNSDALAFDVIKAWLEANGETVKQWVYPK